MSKRRINLSGPDGNVYQLMAIGHQISGQLGQDFKPIMEAMMASDYQHALDVFEEHYGAYCKLVNRPKRSKR